MNAVFEYRFDRSVAEAHARESLATLRSAMDWLEDTDCFVEAHQALDSAGRQVRQIFGCHLGQQGSDYFQECPVALGHNRLGMSVGAVVNRVECSICGADPEDCEHITGRLYDGQRCGRNLCDFEFTEVSIVRRPAFPDARIGSIGVSHESLRAELGPRWKPGTPVRCDRCLSDCDGVAEHPDLGSH